MQAILLAGGLGTRLRSVVSDRPKPMALIQGRPFMEYVIKELAGQAIDHIIFLIYTILIYTILWIRFGYILYTLCIHIISPVIDSQCFKLVLVNSAFVPVILDIIVLLPMPYNDNSIIKRNYKTFGN